MELQIIFWLLIVVTIIELFAIYVMGRLLVSVMIDSVSKKMEQEEEEKKKEDKVPVVKLVLLLFASILPSMLFGAEGDTGGNMFQVDVSIDVLYVIMAIDVLLIGVLWYMWTLVQSFLRYAKTPEELKAAEAKKKKFDIIHILTDAVPIDQEERVTTDHEYDGIRELDNNLPPWWKYGFYLTIVIAIVYLANYHVFQISDLQIEAYEKRMAQAEIEVQEWLASQAMNVDEYSVTFMTETADISIGEQIFVDYCVVCHGSLGEGNVGPNLTDNYWINGGSARDMFTTVKYGAENGMKSWKDELNPIQMQQVVSFIRTLVGTDPPNPKAPEGDLYVEEDEPEVAQDSLAVISLNE